MPDSRFIEVAIGVIFTFVVLSLLCSGLNEWSAGVMERRAGFLLVALQELLGATRCQELLEHGLIDKLSPSPPVGSLWRTIRQTATGHTKRCPAYIPANLFSLALLDTLAPARDDAAPVAAGAAPDSAEFQRICSRIKALAAETREATKVDVAALIATASAGMPPPGRSRRAKNLWGESARRAAADAAADEADAKQRAANAVKERAAQAQAFANGAKADADANPTDPAKATKFAQAMAAAQQAAADADSAAQQAASARAKAMAMQVAPGELEAQIGLYDALLVLLRTSGGDLKAARRNIEAWYSVAMERLLGYYRRRTHLWIIAWATVVTLAANADTAMMAEKLWTTNALRNQVLLSANDAVRQTPPPTSATQPGGMPPSAASAPNAEGQARSKYEDDIRKTLYTIKPFDLPLGWPDAAYVSRLKDYQNLQRKKPLNPPSYLTPVERQMARLWWFWLPWLWIKVPGWLLTIIAASLGAPFWFDLLSKIVNLRLTGNPPDTKSQAPPAAQPAGAAGARA